MLTAQQMSDHIEITQILYRYAPAIDSRDFALLASLFTGDATIHYDVTGGTRLHVTEAVEWLRQALPMFRVTQHALSNPRIDLDGDTARAVTYVTATHVQVGLDGTEVYIVMHGAYSDRLERTDAGWRISERRLDDIHTHGHFLSPDRVRKFPLPAPR